MNADEFVQSLRRLIPTKEEAALAAYTDDELARLARRYACPLRAGRRARPHALEDLLHRYDVSALEIGRVEFVAGPRPHWAGVVVGFFEAEPMVALPSGEVAVFEQARFGERWLECSASPEGLLAALECFVQGYRTRAAWLDNLEHAAARCAALAGGEEYEAFYLALCSVAEYGT